jgi:hypothetical protein
MADPRGFLKYSRVDLKKEDPEERIKHSNEFTAKYSTESLSNQAQRCMDCGVAFCHRGCPLGNLVPEWNRAAAEGHFQSALELLLATNNFPEFTGRVCPAPCESACVLGINSQPVSIENIEMTLAEAGGRSQSWAVDQLGSQPPSNSIDWATASWFLNAQKIPAVCSAMGFRTSNWQKKKSKGAFNFCATRE